MTAGTEGRRAGGTEGRRVEWVRLGGKSHSLSGNLLLSDQECRGRKRGYLGELTSHLERRYVGMGW